MTPLLTSLANQPTPFTSKHCDCASAIPAGGDTPQVTSIGGSPYAVVSGLGGSVLRRSPSSTFFGSAPTSGAQASATSGAGDGTATGVGPALQEVRNSAGTRTAMNRRETQVVGRGCLEMVRCERPGTSACG